jgi:NAD(P)-dependent dehydrogenase (short-subunit alcohol dehydrogenase family)
MDINNKVAVITGGASGLGEATMRRYLEQGAKVAIFDMNDERGNMLAEQLGDNLRYFNVNVTDPESVSKAIAGTLEAFGVIHILNNFAGISYPTKTISKSGPCDLDAYIKIINVNLIGTFNVCRLVAFEMAKNVPVTESGTRGVIINTSSIAAYEGQVGQAAYSASKGGVVGMTLPMARDLARDGIRVNTIVPGLIHTPLFDTLPKELYGSLVDGTLYPKRLGKPEEIAHLSQYLVENDYTNAECIRMDSGIRMQPR